MNILKNKNETEQKQKPAGLFKTGIRSRLGLVKLGSDWFWFFFYLGAGQGWSSSGPEDVDGSDDVLATDGTLAHPLAALGAGDHVTTLQQDAVDGRVHTDLTDVLLDTRGTAAAIVCRQHYVIKVTSISASVQRDVFKRPVLFRTTI